MDGIQRFDNNPIIFPELSESIGTNINGPSLIRVPSWIENPLGKYYLYFAHHQDLFIRLAYTDDLEGDWKIYEPGTLHIDPIMEKTDFHGHIASPDVHVDEEKKEIRMYFHAPSQRTKSQMSGVAASKDGIHFSLLTTEPLGPFYFRVFQWDGSYYAIAKNGNVSGSLLISPDGIAPFKKIKDIIPNMRHAAVLLRGDELLLFYTIVGHAPERILMSTVYLNRKEWIISEAEEIARPQEVYEGIDCPIEPSEFGMKKIRVHQLRDPAVYEENGKTYLLYSVAGEQGIAIAEIKI